MTCREFDKHILPFIEQKLDYKKLDSFLEHDRSCAECHEELEINFLMSYIQQNEDVTSFNLSEELNKHIQTAVCQKKRFYHQMIFHLLLIIAIETITISTFIYFLSIIL